MRVQKESHFGHFRAQDFAVDLVEEETDLPKRTISGIGYEAYGDNAHIEYFSATNNKWLLGEHWAKACQMMSDDVRFFQHLAAVSDHGA